MRVTYEIPDPPWCCDDYPECWHRVEFQRQQEKKNKKDARTENTKCVREGSKEL